MVKQCNTARVAIIGAGPAGLMAAEILSRQGVEIDIYDAMPSPGRKFLLAGVGGMNITHSEPVSDFIGRYGVRAAEVGRWIHVFDPQSVRAWAAELGVETFIGSSGRVFPTEMKAAPLLRAWLQRLRQSGVRLHVRHRWLGWREDGALRLATPVGEISVVADATVLALGGASWPKLGSDGAWVKILGERGVTMAPLQPANCGFDVSWTPHLRERFAGAPLKSVAMRFTDLSGQTEYRAGEFVITETGVEGSLIYAFSARLRDSVALQGSATFYLDLIPQKDEASLAAELARPRGADSMANHLRRRVGIEGIKAGLLRECILKEDFNDPQRLAAAIKHLPITVIAPRPIEEAISSAGGVQFEALDDNLMLRALPGTFCAGEMLDWEAPTGGYLLTACLASGRAVAQGVVRHLVA